MIDKVIIQHDFRYVIQDVQRGVVEKERFWIYINDERADFECTGKDIVSLGAWKFEEKHGDIVLRNGSKSITLKQPLSVMNADYEISCLAATDDGQRAIGGTQGQLKFISSDGKCVEVDNAHYSDVLQIQYFPSKQVAMTIGLDFSIKIWSVLDGSNPRTMRKHTAMLTALAAIGRGRNIVSGARDGALYIWECASGQPVWEFRRVKNMTDPVVGLAVIDTEETGNDARPVSDSIFYETENKNLLVGYESGVVSTYDLGTRCFLGEFSAGDKMSAFAANKEILVTGHSDGTIRCFRGSEKIWELHSDEEVRKIQISDRKIFCLQRQVAIVDYNGKIDSIFSDYYGLNDFCAIPGILYVACKDKTLKKINL
ncbi:hypothetical protein KL905_002007 [Ogataea polymorpha]|nr:hypothetical protein KL908_000644 [Ogataea polymorpha]KAG7903930.1 hypothetical protein KL935_000069 [Ogataea polymorpha]KAG7908566.1 hypothetical protein KL907_002056 [Ogataea polymorpha]KAG7922786.1 hypothetical protein KL905_002007 [Ogataea polymorpha]